MLLECMDRAKGGIKAWGAKGVKSISRKGWPEWVPLNYQHPSITPVYIHVYRNASVLSSYTFRPFFSNSFFFLSLSSPHKGCHVKMGEKKREGEMERGRNVLPKCLFARLSGVWSPRELILPRLRLICFLCCLLKVITSCLEIYKRTAQGEPPPKGVGTEWKISHTSGRCRWDLRTGVSEFVCVCVCGMCVKEENH